ncbi:MAG: hypothetical protein EOO85_24935 [Pedobacter sp.]|nr:MAG: hypothetical protein EOO85_24935 [Pedobacter sp.]
MKGRDHVKYLLCLGVADKIVNESKNEWWGYSPSALFLLREKSSASEITGLIEIVESGKLNSFERFLVSTSAFTKNDLNDIAGTTSLREYDFAAAEKWLSKVPGSYYEAEPFTTYLAANPFADLILDTHQPTEADSVNYTRSSFSKKMIRLKREAGIAADTNTRAKTYYELAKGYYHMSYWGNSWLLARYSWSGSEYEYGDKTRNRDYFNVDTAKAYYLRAYNTSADNNFKAKALFMAAKCDQKLFGNLPDQYNDPSSSDYQKDLTAWLTKFDKRNNYFSTLGKNYRTTAFFKEAQRTCSYLDDFVKKMKK